MRPTLADVVRLNLNSRPHPPTLPAGAAFLAASHALHIANTPRPPAENCAEEMENLRRKLLQKCAVVQENCAKVVPRFYSASLIRYDTIRCDTRCYFNMRSKADMNRLNLPHGTDN